MEGMTEQQREKVRRLTQAIGRGLRDSHDLDQEGEEEEKVQDGGLRSPGQ